MVKILLFMTGFTYIWFYIKNIKGTKEMLTGQYYPTIDANGRLAFPAKLREELGERFIITRWTEDCLVAFSEEEWKITCEKIRNSSYTNAIDMRRYLFPYACTVEPDKQGRVIIPATLREHIGITDEVVIVGNMDRAEIWVKEKWNEIQQELTADIFYEQLKELGI